MANMFSRRTVLGGIGALGALGLAACSTGGTPGGSTSTAPTGAFTPPKYIPFAGVTPELPASADGVIPVFTKYPNPPVVREGFPLPQTNPVTALLQGPAPAIAPDSNPAYQQAQTSVGNKFETTTVLAAQYLEKFQTTMAGNDLPDFVQLVPVQQYPKLVESKFTDLSDFLGGDNIAKYPGLANIPPESWKIGTVNGRLYGIVQPRPPAGGVLSTRGDLLKAKGIDSSPEIANGAELLELMKTLTDKAKNQFAMGSVPSSWLLPTILEMMGAPNSWVVEDGKFQSQITSPQMPQALSEVAKFWAAGVFHPNSFSDPGSNFVWWQSGVSALYRQGFTGWAVYAQQNPSWDVGIVRLPKWDGGGKAPIFKTPPGYLNPIGIRKQDSDARVEELLKIADYFASPFGTQQYLEVNFGKEGTSYTMNNGEPALIDGQAANLIQGWGYVGGNSGNVLYLPGQEALAKSQHAYLSEVLPTGVANAALGLYSETDLAKSATFSAEISDLQMSIIQGRKPVSEWETFAAKWKSEIGDKIAGEFEEAAAKQ